LTAQHLTVRHGPVIAVRPLDLRLHAGEVVALMGRNGAGKSTLLGALCGLVTPGAGSARVADHDPAALKGRDLIRHVGVVPQQPGDLLYADTVAEECRTADREAGVAAGTTAALLTRLVGGELDVRLHPRDLSEGQRLCVALAVVLAAAPPLLLLDEPTRGLDYPAKARLVTTLRELAANGHAVVLATHDVELAAEVSARTVVLADGEIVADGPSRDVVTQSPVFAPQIAKVLAPLPYLTVGDVERSLALFPAGARSGDAKASTSGETARAFPAGGWSGDAKASTSGEKR
jgi:energy-coupling factor transport system ATP-binding protein